MKNNRVRLLRKANIAAKPSVLVSFATGTILVVAFFWFAGYGRDNIIPLRLHNPIFVATICLYEAGAVGLFVTRAMMERIILREREEPYQPVQLPPHPHHHHIRGIPGNPGGTHLPNMEVH